MPTKTRIHSQWAYGSSHSYGPFASGVDVEAYTVPVVDFISHGNGFRKVNFLMSIQRSNVSSGLTEFDTHTGEGLFKRGYRGGVNHIFYNPGPSLIDQYGSLNGWGAIGLSRAINSHVGGTGDIGVTGGELLTALPTLRSVRKAIRHYKKRRSLDETLPMPRGLPNFKLNFNRRGKVSKENFDKAAKFLGGLYLGYQFGVKPSTESFLNALEVYGRAQKALRQKPKWKKYRINLETSYRSKDHIVGTRNVPVDGSVEYNGGTVVRESAIWFTCHLRDKDSLTHKQRQKINAGSIVDGRSLYALAPWSWLADWLIPISQNLDNINMANYVHIKHCAVMNHVSYKANASSTVTYVAGDGEESVEVNSSHDVDMRRRVPFSSFGISLVLPKLTLFRASILGALAATYS